MCVTRWNNGASCGGVCVTGDVVCVSLNGVVVVCVSLVMWCVCVTRWSRGASCGGVCMSLVMWCVCVIQWSCGGVCVTGDVVCMCHW